MTSKGARWFVKQGETIHPHAGFKSKDDAAEWVRTHPNLDWSAGWVFRFYGDKEDRIIVNKHGIKPSLK